MMNTEKILAEYVASLDAETLACTCGRPARLDGPRYQKEVWRDAPGGGMYRLGTIWPLISPTEAAYISRECPTHGYIVGGK